MKAKKGEVVATKTIVRYTPPNDIVGRREITVASAESVGIFTQTRDLQWDREKGFWLDAKDISKEMLAWLEDPANSDDVMGHFTVERQEVASAATTKKEGE